MLSYMMEAYNKSNLMKIADAISKGRDELGDISTYGRTILRFILVKYSGRVQTEFKWLKKGVSDELL